jgi:predicted oxidoreductase
MVRLIETALDQGIFTFDHADIYGDYGNEQLFGEALRLQPALKAKVQIVTKCGIKLLSAKKPDHRVKHYDTSRAHIIASVENSLRALDVDQLEVLLLHRPDPLLDAAEVAEAFETLKKDGKVRFFGVSNFTPAQFDLLRAYVSAPLVTNQIELSLFKPQPVFDGTVDHLYRLRVAPMAWSPLGGGHMPVDEHLFFPLAAKYNATYTQLALAWLLKHPATIFPVIGTTQPDRIKEAAHAATIDLDRQDWFEMLRWITGKEVA